MFQSPTDKSVSFVLQLIASIAILLVIMIVAFLMHESQPALNELG